MDVPKHNPDRAAMKRVGEQVRARLAADPAIYKLPTDIAEIYALGDFLTAAECQRFIEMTDAIAKPSQLHLTAYIEKFRTSYSGDYDTRDPFVKGISRRIDDVLGLDPEWGESIQGQRYIARARVQGAQRLVLHRSGLLEGGRSTWRPALLDSDGFPQSGA